MRRESRGVRQRFGVRRYIAVLAATATDLGASVPFSDYALPPAMLVALQDGYPGELALLEWSAYASASLYNDESAKVWILCTTIEVETVVSELPHLQSFFVDESSSWEQVLEEFFLLSSNLHQHTGITGLFGEGSLPHPELSEAIESLRPSLVDSVSPTVILTRSRSRGDGAEPGLWLSDTLITQIWCNEAMPAESSLLKNQTLQSATLLEVLPILLQDPSGIGVVLVDGTQVLRSIFAVGYPSSRVQNVDGADIAVGDAVPTGLKANGQEGNPVHIGSVGLALVFNGNSDPGRGDGVIMSRFGDQSVGRTSIFQKAQWPPEYVLETVANKNGLVIVSNVNCGYLDMATNFLMSVRRTTDAKVLFVAMDDVSFDVMDALAPGCTALFPSGSSHQHHHATKAGVIGDKNFAAEVLVRPNILTYILKQGYSVLWTDSDMVWLENPLPLLPDVKDPLAADVMLQYDGNSGNKCSCFMFLKPTMMTRMLLKLWGERIVEDQSAMNQLPLQGPLQHMREAGLKVEFMPVHAMPAGKHFFDHEYVEDYLRLYHNKTVVVHNNWIKGHALKKKRFQEYHLWSVEDVEFPDCEESPSGSKPSSILGLSVFQLLSVCSCFALLASCTYLTYYRNMSLLSYIFPMWRVRLQYTLSAP